MDRAALEHGAPGTVLRGSTRSRVVLGRVLHAVRTAGPQCATDASWSSVEALDDSQRSASQSAGGALDDGVEHALEVGRRRGDDAQDLGGGGLLLQRLGDLAVALLKLGVALLQLREQPGVLDGDDGLVGERLQQRDLRGR